jgi:hypothetical protein
VVHRARATGSCRPASAGAQASHARGGQLNFRPALPPSGAGGTSGWLVCIRGIANCVELTEGDIRFVDPRAADPRGLDRGESASARPRESAPPVSD